MKGTQSHLSHKCISPIKVDIRVEAIIMLFLETMHIGDVQCTIKTLEVGTEVTLALEEITHITRKVVRGIETITMIIGETIIEVRVMTEIRVGY